MHDDTISLFDLPHREARRLVATGVPVFLPIDPVEYHGPHLSLHNDHLVSTGLARGTLARLRREHPGARDWPFVLASNLELGAEPVPGPGTRAIRYRTERSIVVRACEALAELGAKRVVLMTFHGAPLHSVALQHGVRALVRHGVRALAPFHALLRILLEGDPREFAGALAHVAEPEQSAMIDALPLDFHAGFVETSFALHYAPRSVDPIHLDLPDCPPIPADARLSRASLMAERAGRARFSRELRYAALGVGWASLRPFPGYTGRPRHARAEAGAFFARVAEETCARACSEVFDGAPPPEPLMGWLEAATLGGRLEAPSASLDDVERFDRA